MIKFQKNEKLNYQCDPILDTDRVVSFTQFSLYESCPHRWKLSYVDKKRDKTPNINLFFGTVIHKVIQTCLTEKIENVDSFYSDTYITEFEKSIKENDGKTFSDPDELGKYFDSGLNIVKKYLTEYKKYFEENELLGIEVPLAVTILDDYPNIKFLGYIDLCDRQKNKSIVLHDYKTSKSGWGSYQFNDVVKLGQLLLYKHFFTKLYNQKFNKITSVFTIFKVQQSDDDIIETFIPKQTAKDCSNIIKKLEEFVINAFTKDGKYRKDVNHPAIRGMNSSNCKFCEFKDNRKLCPIENRKLMKINDTIKI